MGSLRPEVAEFVSNRLHWPADVSVGLTGGRDAGISVSECAPGLDRTRRSMSGASGNVEPLLPETTDLLRLGEA